MSFKGCRDQAEALDRLDAWLAELDDATIRRHAGELIRTDVDAEELARQIIELRGFLRRTGATPALGPQSGLPHSAFGDGVQ